VKSIHKSEDLHGRILPDEAGTTVTLWNNLVSRITWSSLRRFISANQNGDKLCFAFSFWAFGHNEQKRIARRRTAQFTLLFCLIPQIQRVYSSMSLLIRYNDQVSFGDTSDPQQLLVETRLNLLALEYGYRYRLDVRAANGLPRVEFVRTLREARCVGRPLRTAGGLVRLLKILEDGTLKKYTH
jgi:hypothetical protein